MGSLSQVSDIFEDIWKPRARQPAYLLNVQKFHLKVQVQFFFLDYQLHSAYGLMQFYWPLKKFTLSCFLLISIEIM